MNINGIAVVGVGAVGPEPVNPFLFARYYRSGIRGRAFSPGVIGHGYACVRRIPALLPRPDDSLKGGVSWRYLRHADIATVFHDIYRVLQRHSRGRHIPAWLYKQKFPGLAARAAYKNVFSAPNRIVLYAYAFARAARYILPLYMADAGI